MIQKINDDFGAGGKPDVNENPRSKLIVECLTSHGIKVLPVHGIKDGNCTCNNDDCKRPGKHPVNKDFASIATTEKLQIEEWFDVNLDWNVGILLGTGSDVCDIEFDSVDGRETANRLFADILTPAYESERSIHRLFRLPKDLKGLKAKMDVQGLEVRLGTRAAYSVAPPSIHKSGSVYKWLKTPNELKFAEFPPAVLQLISDSKGSTSLDVEVETDATSKLFNLDTLVDVPVGERHSELCRAFGCDLSNHGYTGLVASALFKAASRLGIDTSEVVENILPIADKEIEESKKCIVFQSSVVAQLRQDIDSDYSVPIYHCGDGEFKKFRLSPNTITVIGAETGAGKTALATQMVFDAAIAKQALKVLICNVEVTPALLARRQVANLSSIPFEEFLRGTLSRESKKRAFKTIDEIESLMISYSSERDLLKIKKACLESKPDIVLVDYLQRFSVGGKASTAVDRISAVMEELRRIADSGSAVVAVSATSRNSAGRETKSCFRDSSEIEFGCNDAYVLKRAPEATKTVVEHVKARDRGLEDIHLDFYGPLQRFESSEVKDV